MAKIPHAEPHPDVSGQKLNWLRAAVLGANDGIVSVAALVVGIAAASESAAFILAAGIAGIVSGALSMAVGEYVSVSTQRDTERALIEKEKEELASEPQHELEELARVYEDKGLSGATARQVAKELTEHDAFAAHAEAELHIDPGNLTNPWYAAFASALSFTAGAVVPVLVIVLSPPAVRVPATFVAVAIALAATGTWSAYMGGANKTRATARVVVGGILAMVITFGVGRLFGVTGI
jgi:VIT1/CCC1 family predicted Fe2+/Mn2+ transporter